LSRRVSLPTADDLFRPTATPDDSAAAEPEASVDASAGVETGLQAVPEPEPATRKPSGRVRHDEKMTVYVTSDELLDLEHARLMLRRSHGLSADRGRLVREAIAMVLADFEENGADSALVQRLRES
jgi:hypothetical protein